MQCARNIMKVDRISEVTLDISLCPTDHRRFCFRILNHHLVGHEGKLLSKDF